MLFNSINFAIFLPIVFLLYWFVTKNNLKFQNILLLVASYYFYACWDFRFLFLLIFSTLLDYYSGIKIENSSSEKNRKFWFWLSIGINLGFLGVFKYYNFFVDSIKDVVFLFGHKIDLWTIKVILPVGISFYTFHGLSYVIDIYKKRIPVETNFINYATFVCYFPLLVAGPIERATHLLPQIKKKRTFNYAQAVDGLRQILWGLFKKIVIADNCAEYANLIFNNSDDYSGSTLIMGALFFTFQIYGDFSGYSDIALGTSRLFGMELLKNFNFPYFSRDIAEFWRRWHISLSSWFKDYLYIPLGGSVGGLKLKIRNTFIIFLVSGFWHGANWTFIVWGALNALYFLPLLLSNTNRNYMKIVAYDSNLPSFKELVSIIITFSLTVFAWIFFRANSLTHAITYIKDIFTSKLIALPEVRPTFVIVLVAIFILIEWIGRRNNYALEKMFTEKSVFVRWSFYFVLLFAIFIFSTKEQEFIYFQF
ncbi:MBOAT family O-acyltransferase [Flavobacterium urocaniciphilum]|uniref:D-alanyl-lipoteichoic acid acyltransferase DltB, MBOAT superfamily n=1 Tax=Flavobacterium urocaniciphilum TaxID=1299341 RepID=A0A1H8YS93_9FLAO|nr:MBOAT family O-acyltransferase [Flavobacterium urocaniciphilum]SEP54891.1 D-alanyl-lipoteichoic acid acyltransferase DltB, MBOAT superfamily [Flavobacterium urocaniciphilum]